MPDRKKLKEITDSATLDGEVMPDASSATHQLHEITDSDELNGEIIPDSQTAPDATETGNPTPSIPESATPYDVIGKVFGKTPEGQNVLDPSKNIQPSPQATKVKLDQATKFLADYAMQNLASLPASYTQNYTNPNTAEPGNLLHDITNPHGDPRHTGSYAQTMVADLERQKQKAIQDAGYNNPQLSSGLSDYGLSDINKKYNEQIAQVKSNASQVISAQLFYEEYAQKPLSGSEATTKLKALEKQRDADIANANKQMQEDITTGDYKYNLDQADAIRQDKIKQINNRYNSESLQVKNSQKWDAVRLGVEHQKLLGDPEAIRDAANMDAGKPIPPANKYKYQLTGNEILKTGSQLAEANGQKPVAQQAQSHIKTDKQLENENLDYFVPQWEQAIGNAKYADENLLFRSIVPHLGSMSKGDVEEYGEQAGLTKSQIAKVDPEKVPTSATLWQQFIGGAANTAAPLYENFIGKPLMRASGASDEEINQHFQPGWENQRGLAAGIVGNIPSDQNSFHNVRGALGQVFSGAGALATFGGEVGGVAKGAEALGLASDAAKAEKLALFGVTSFNGYNSAYHDANEVIGDKPEDEWKRRAYAATRGILEGIIFSGGSKYELAKFSGGSKYELAKNAFWETMGKSGDQLLDEIKNAKDVGVLQSPTFKEAIVKKIMASGNELGKQVKLSVANDMAKDVVNTIVNPNKKQDISEDIKNIAISTSLAMLIPSIMGGVGHVNNETPLNTAAAFEIGSHPQEYLATIDKQYQNGKITRQDLSTLRGAIGAMQYSVNEAPTETPDGRKLTPNQIKAYAFNRFQEHLLLLKQDQTNKTATDNNMQPDKAMLAPISKRISELEKQRGDILKNAGQLRPPTPQPEESNQAPADERSVATNPESEPQAPETKKEEKIAENQKENIPLSSDNNPQLKSNEDESTSNQEGRQDGSQISESEGSGKDAEIRSSTSGELPGEQEDRQLAENGKDKNQPQAAEVQPLPVEGKRPVKKFGLKPKTEEQIPIQKNDAFEAMDLGDQGGKPIDEVKPKIDAADPYEKIGGGESFDDFKERIRKAWQKTKKTAEDQTLLQTHSGVMRMIEAAEKHGWTDVETLKKAYDATEEPEVGERHTYKTDNGEIHVMRHGESEDLKAELARRHEDPLTPEGQRQAKEDIAGHLKEEGITPPAIIVDGMPRTAETAEIVQQELVKPEEAKGDLGGKLKNSIPEDKRKDVFLVSMDEIKSIQDQQHRRPEGKKNVSTMEAEGIKEPIEVYVSRKDGKMMIRNGNHRIDEADRMGAENIPVHVTYVDGLLNSKAAKEVKLKSLTPEEVKPAEPAKGAPKAEAPPPAKKEKVESPKVVYQRRKKQALSSDPQSLREAVLQAIVKKGVFSYDDIKNYFGISGNDMRTYIGRVAKNGMKVDHFVEQYHNPEGDGYHFVDDTIQGKEDFMDIWKDFGHSESKALDELEKIQGVHTEMTEEEYEAHKVAEQLMSAALKQIEDFSEFGNHAALKKANNAIVDADLSDADNERIENYFLKHIDNSGKLNGEKALNPSDKDFKEMYQNLSPDAQLLMDSLVADEETGWTGLTDKQQSDYNKLKENAKNKKGKDAGIGIGAPEKPEGEGATPLGSAGQGGPADEARAVIFEPKPEGKNNNENRPDPRYKQKDPESVKTNGARDPEKRDAMVKKVAEETGDFNKGFHEAGYKYIDGMWVDPAAEEMYNSLSPEMKALFKERGINYFTDFKNDELGKTNNLERARYEVQSMDGKDFKGISFNSDEDAKALTKDSIEADFMHEIGHDIWANKLTDEQKALFQHENPITQHAKDVKEFEEGGGQYGHNDEPNKYQEEDFAELFKDNNGDLDKTLAAAKENQKKNTIEVNPLGEKRQFQHTKGAFSDKDGNLYKSTENTAGEPTQEHKILKSLQDIDNIVKVGKEVKTSEGPAFEMEKLTPLKKGDKITQAESKSLLKTMEEMDKRGIFTGEMEFGRDKDGNLKVFDLSTAEKRDTTDPNYSTESNNANRIREYLTPDDLKKFNDERSAKADQQIEDVRKMLKLEEAIEHTINGGISDDGLQYAYRQANELRDKAKRLENSSDPDDQAKRYELKEKADKIQADAESRIAPFEKVVNNDYEMKGLKSKKFNETRCRELSKKHQEKYGGEYKEVDVTNQDGSKVKHAVVIHDDYVYEPQTDALIKKDVFDNFFKTDVSDAKGDKLNQEQKPNGAIATPAKPEPELPSQKTGKQLDEISKQIAEQQAIIKKSHDEIKEIKDPAPEDWADHFKERDEAQDKIADLKKQFNQLEQRQRLEQYRERDETASGKLANYIEDQYAKNKKAHEGEVYSGILGISTKIGNHVADFVVARVVEGLRSMQTAEMAIRRAIRQAKEKYGKEAEDLSEKDINAIKEHLDLNEKVPSHEPSLPFDYEDDVKGIKDDIQAGRTTYEEAVHDVMNGEYYNRAGELLSEHNAENVKDKILSYLNWHEEGRAIHNAELADADNKNKVISDYGLKNGDAMTRMLSGNTIELRTGDEPMNEQQAIKYSLEGAALDAQAMVSKMKHHFGNDVTEYGPEMLKQIDKLPGGDTVKRVTALLGLMDELRKDQDIYEDHLATLGYSDKDVAERRATNERLSQIPKMLKKAEKTYQDTQREASKTINTGRIMAKLFSGKFAHELLADEAILPEKDREAKKQVENKLADTKIPDAVAKQGPLFPEEEANAAVEEAQKQMAKNRKKKTGEKPEANKAESLFPEESPEQPAKPEEKPKETVKEKAKNVVKKVTEVVTKKKTKDKTAVEQMKKEAEAKLAKKGMNEANMFDKIKELLKKNPCE